MSDCLGGPPLVPLRSKRHTERSMNLIHIEVEIVIAQPPEVVFDFVADDRNEPRFSPQMRSAEQLTPDPIGLGTRFRARVTSRGGHPRALSNQSCWRSSPTSVW